MPICAKTPACEPRADAFLASLTRFSGSRQPYAGALVRNCSASLIFEQTPCGFSSLQLWTILNNHTEVRDLILILVRPSQQSLARPRYNRAVTESTVRPRSQVCDSRHPRSTSIFDSVNGRPSSVRINLSSTHQLPDHRRLTLYCCGGFGFWLSSCRTGAFIIVGCSHLGASFA